MSFPTTIPNQLFIDGQWRDSADGKTRDVVNPVDEQAFDRIAVASDDDIARALESAQAGLARWRATDAWTRSATIRRIADLLREWAPEAAALMTREQGKTLAESRSEWAAAADQFDWYADEARRIYGRTIDGHNTAVRLMVNREPVGVVAAFSSWNFPALLPSRKMAPALAAGCAIIVKPAQEAPFSTLLIAEACRQAGVPAGVVTMLTGESRRISSALIQSEVVRKISLTGSVPVGRELLHAAADRIVKASMELGGHAPVLIFADSDVEAAATACATFKFRNAGQVCASPSRFIVHDDIAEEFTAKLVEATAKLRVGDGAAEGTDVGPLNNSRRIEAAEALVADAVAKGATVLHGGRRDATFERGFFFEPTVLADVPQDAEIMREEPFAPIAPVARFSNFDEAIAMANSTNLGLASYVFTRDLATAYRAAEAIEAGMVGINNLGIATAEAPFGGIKESGYGREGGAEGILDYTVSKYINIQL